MTMSWDCGLLVLSEKKSLISLLKILHYFCRFLHFLCDVNVYIILLTVKLLKIGTLLLYFASSNDGIYTELMHWTVF